MNTKEAIAKARKLAEPKCKKEGLEILGLSYKEGDDEVYVSVARKQFRGEPAPAVYVNIKTNQVTIW